MLGIVINILSNIQNKWLLLLLLFEVAKCKTSKFPGHWIYTETKYIKATKIQRTKSIIIGTRQLSVSSLTVFPSSSKL